MTTLTAGADPSVAERDPAEVTSAGGEPPRWLCLLALVPATGMLSLGSVGLLLAVNGWYRPVLAFPIGIGCGSASLCSSSPLFRTPSMVQAATREAKVCAAIGVVAILAITAWNMGNNSTHVLIDRDGGSYSNTGRWIARNGSLTVKPRVGPFAQEPTVGFDSQAVYALPDGNLQFQFAHFLPVVLAESYAIAGDTGLFHTPELLSGIAMLAFFVLAWRLIRRPLFALAAMLALSLTLPQVSFARDSYSEIPSQILLFTAVWLLVSPRVSRWRLALGAGLFLGALEATRIDAVVFLIGVPVLAAVALVAQRRRGSPSDARVDRGVRRRVGPRHAARVRRSHAPQRRLLGRVAGERRSARSGNGGFARHLRDPRGHLALRLPVRAPPAVERDLQRGRGVGGDHRVRDVGAAPEPATSARQLAGRGRPPTGGQSPHRRNAALLRAVAHLDVVVPRSADTCVRDHWRGSAVTRAACRGQKLYTFGAVAVLVPGSLLYLYMAKAVPDHVWVTRRFLVSAMPTLLLLALGLAAHMASARSPGGWGRAAGSARSSSRITAVAFPVYTIIPVRAMAEETGYLDLVHDTCAALGPDAAVIVLEAAGPTRSTTGTRRRSGVGAARRSGSRCGIANADALHRLARSWDTEGKKLFVVSSTLEDLLRVLPDAEVKADCTRSTTSCWRRRSRTAPMLIGRRISQSWSPAFHPADRQQARWPRKRYMPPAAGRGCAGVVACGFRLTETTDEHDPICGFVVTNVNPGEPELQPEPVDDTDRRFERDFGDAGPAYRLRGRLRVVRPVGQCVEQLRVDEAELPAEQAHDDRADGADTDPRARRVRARRSRL